MTVGLVVAGHSRPLARAAAALASEMTPGRPVPIEVAAGLDEETFGTDAVAISEAITAADDGDGVVVLMDLGSAVLSAETALELLDEPLRERVLLCPAPLVEGLVAAAVTAGAGGTREEVAAEALAGLAGKEAHFGTAGEEPSRTGEGVSAVVRVVNEHGLHARPAARLVGELRRFDALVELRNENTGSGWVPASSLTRVATLGALRGHELAVRASGRQAQEAVDRFVELAGDAFGETQDHVNHSRPEPTLHRGSPTGNYPADGGSLPKPCGQPENVDNPPTPGRSASTLRAAPSSPGIAIGPAVRLSQPALHIPDEPSMGSEAEQHRLTDALTTARHEIGKLSGDIFEAHLMLLEDADLLDEARAAIDKGTTAPEAWRDTTNRVAAEFDALPDPYLRARADDVRAVSDQVLRALLGVPAATVDGEGILMATDLTPAQAAALDPVRIAGVVLRNGSPTSHAAILLRTRGIPAVIGDIPEGALIALDGSTGDVAVDPAPDVLEDFRSRAERHKKLSDEARTKAAQPAMTRNGVTIHVGANIGSVAEARAAADNGADLAGLVRTEFLFLDRDTAPDADEQEAVYLAIADALGGRRITLRTLDAGSDKPLRYLPAPSEANPFLGVRGIRHSLVHRSMFTEQLRAIVRVARRTPVSVMFPMVTTPDEVVEARRMLDEVGDLPPDLRVGMMVEVPAAALRAADFTPYVDFFSIGTNDLTQYTLAAERGNADLLDLTSGLDPAVEQLIEGVCRAAGPQKTVAVCGELAGDGTVVPRLLAAGVRELSVAPALVPVTKQAVRAT
ncbi:phosphoenolpyruvate--protein phosphotransferase [Paractinoplanes brasiliensis]|uniref:Phosphocarrier protein HPr n=1 Tax=Paractinoplanes brasiliensis TaxID=52695 RepID=A0A4R6JAT4_9ACTN|nr:phosphoenolpyruvate--protein phosphotransferase [Actinoplanes brasiliensis]TDO32779.1 phosphocarrier protein FPr [Actinoplanes brasiliensis]GID31677.1 multiphosphoryl transfer protein (MTP) [Actinoplanes brasiliensis]